MTIITLLTMTPKQVWSQQMDTLRAQAADLRPAPAELQKATTQSLLSSGTMWKRCYLCPSLYRCGTLEMCEEELPPSQSRLNRLLASLGLAPN